jgi:hypothetical protein
MPECESSPMVFRCSAFRFSFIALDPIFFAPGAAGNSFRGAFGHIFRKVVCDSRCSDAEACEMREQCAYARLFEPVCRAGPSGLADAPRPFVIRASTLDGQTYRAGESFSIDLHLFDWREPALAGFIGAFQQLAVDGIGAGRGRIELREVSALNRARRPETAAEPISIHLAAPPAGSAQELTLRFATPTELKGDGQIARDAPFELVIARARDRIASLSALYAATPLALDFRGMAERAAGVRIERSRLEWQHFQRKSSRTRQIHSLSGFTGEVRYQGPVVEFIPLLEAAYWTGIGRHTVWGKGAVEIVV